MTIVCNCSELWPLHIIIYFTVNRNKLCCHSNDRIINKNGLFSIIKIIKTCSIKVAHIPRHAREKYRLLYRSYQLLTLLNAPGKKYITCFDIVENFLNVGCIYTMKITRVMNCVSVCYVCRIDSYYVHGKTVREAQLYPVQESWGITS